MNISNLKLINALGGKDNLRGVKLKGGLTNTVIFKLADVSKVKIMKEHFKNGQCNYLISVKLDSKNYTDLYRNLSELMN